MIASNNLTDANGIIRAINYQWLSNGVIVSTQNFYALTQADVGKTISVIASYTDGLDKLETVISNSVVITNANDAPMGTVTISGTPKQNQILTASNSLADLHGIGLISYQWLSDGKIILRKIGDTYALMKADINKNIRVIANYTDGFATISVINDTSLPVLVTR